MKVEDHCYRCSSTHGQHIRGKAHVHLGGFPAGRAGMWTIHFLPVEHSFPACEGQAPEHLPCHLRCTQMGNGKAEIQTTSPWQRPPCHTTSADVTMFTKPPSPGVQRALSPQNCVSLTEVGSPSPAVLARSPAEHATYCPLEPVMSPL